MRVNRSRNPSPITIRILAVAVILILMTLTMALTSPAQAEKGDVTPIPTPTPLGDVSADANCRMCHTDHNFRGRFQNGDIIDLYVDSGQFDRSVHGTAGLECIACHPQTASYPHEAGGKQIDCVVCHPQQGGEPEKPGEALIVDLPYADARDMTLTINNACRSCHKEEFKAATDSAHVKVLKAGNIYAPVCVDCHGSHDTTPPDQPRSKISQSCGECHRSVYTTYRFSVHGAALEENSNPDVPTCVDCHGAHQVRGPRNPDYRDDSIAICGGCHADKELMGKYGISTDVFETYLDDFHGRSVNLYRLSGDQRQASEATCFDCHGIHNILPPDDPRSSIYPTNLQHTCQQCHEDANIRFPDAWLSHYIPDKDKTPILFFINSLYQFLLIPGVIGGFLIYIGLDTRKRWSEKRKKTRQAVAIAEEALKEELGDDHDFSEED